LEYNSDMKKFLIFLLSFLTGLGIFIWVIKWVGWQEIKKPLFALSGYQGIAILILTILIWSVGLWKWKFILKSQGYNLPTLSLGEIFFASYTITYLLTPTAVFGGEAFRVYATKKKFSLPWEKNLAAIAIERLLSSSILLIFLILGTISFLFLASPPFKNFGIIATILIGLLGTGLVIFYFRSFKKESILKFFFKFLKIRAKKNNNYAIENIEKEIFYFFDFKKIIMWKGLGISLLRFLLILTRCWVLVLFLKGGINILISLAILFFLYLSYLVPLPAGLGSLEAAQAFAFGSLGLGTASGITFSFVLRGTEILVALFGLILLIKLGIKLFIENIGNLIEKYTTK
jgi:uncharacterized protein (TIRG00374 family)